MAQIEMRPPDGFRRSHAGVPPGTWSDDGAQALILLDTLVGCNGLDLYQFSKGLCDWKQSGFYAVDNTVFDIGVQTSSAIEQLCAGTSPANAGLAEEYHNGNGSLMRVLPLVLWHHTKDEWLVELAMRQSLPTHGHLRSQICCAMYCLWARRVLQGASDPWGAAEQVLRSVLLGHEYATELELVLDPANSEVIGGTGYVIDALWSGKWAFESTNNYEACVRRAIGLGNDTDTTACIAGGIAGLRYGVEGIPTRWREELRGKEWVEPLLSALLNDPIRQAVAKFDLSGIESG